MADEKQLDPGTLLQWEFPERPKYSRGMIWYFLMTLVGLGLLIYAVYSANFLFALIIIMLGLVIYVTGLSDPKPVEFAVTESGVNIGGQLFAFKDIERFWFFYEPPVKSLYIHMQGIAGPRIRIDLMDQDPNQVREVLGQFVNEDYDETEEPISDVMSRLLKL